MIDEKQICPTQQLLLTGKIRIYDIHIKVNTEKTIT